MTIRAIIAEDEELARRHLADLIEEVEWLEAVGEASDGATAVRLIDELRPDIVFLDVRMPELTGLQVLERIRHDPLVVFTTAYDRYAVAAFELEALDYLVKPFGRQRFQSTLERIRRTLQEPGASPPSVQRAATALTEGPVRRLFARKGNRIVPIPVELVAHFEARDDYVAVHSGGETHLLHLTLTELEQRLDPERFRRIHRSHIVNLDHVASLRPHDDRRLMVSLRGGGEILASRSGSQHLREMVD